MLGYLSLDIICSSKLTVFLELRSWKTVRFSEHIMSADKYPSIFSRQMEAIVYISPEVFFIVLQCLCCFLFIRVTPGSSWFPGRGRRGRRRWTKGKFTLTHEYCVSIFLGFRQRILFPDFCFLCESSLPIQVYKRLPAKLMKRKI